MRHAPLTTNFGGAHIAHDNAIPPDHIDEVVRVCRLADFDFLQSIRFIKIDVEGAEPKVIDGALELICTQKPLIMSEIHNYQLKKVSGINGDEYIEKMKSLGYQCNSIENGHLGHIISEYKDERPLNVIFNPIMV